MLATEEVTWGALDVEDPDWFEKYAKPRESARLIIFWNRFAVDIIPKVSLD